VRRARSVREPLTQHWAIVAPLFHDALESSVDSMIAARNFVVHRLPRSETASNQARDLFWLTEGHVPD